MATRSRRRSRPVPIPSASPGHPVECSEARIALVLIALAVAAHAGALGAAWIWDDDDYVTANATLRTLEGLRRIWLEPGAVPQYYPITFTSFWIEYHLWGLVPFGYHLTNVLLHAVNTVLAWRVLRRLAIPGAAVAAAVFAVHPVHVETVAWVTERKNLLSGVGTLGALLAYLRVARIPEGGPAVSRPAAYAIALGLFGAAMLSKTVACTLPAVILIVVWWKRGRVAMPDVLPLLPFFGLALALGAGTIWMERYHVGATGVHFSLTPGARVLVAGRALWFYATKLLWPVPLIFVYPRWRPDPAAAWQWLFPATALVAVAVALLARARVGRGAFAGLAAFAITLAPALGFVDVYPMRYSFVADHFQYLASLAVVALVVAVVAARAGPGASRQRWRHATAAGVVLVLLGLAVQRTQAFRDARTLWRDTLEKNPDAAMAHVNLGLLLQRAGETAEAVDELRRAVALEPEEADVHDDLGIALAALGRTEEALAQFTEALRLDPRRAETQSNLGNLLAGAGRLPEAAEHFEAALALRARYPDAENNLANVLAMQGNGPAAIAHYRAALALDPSYADAHHNLGVLLAAAGDGDEALRHLAEAVRLRPDYPEGHLDLGRALADHGRNAEAADHFRFALRLRPAWPDAERELTRVTH